MISSSILDVAIPGAIAIGAGIFSYILSGGEEEYPETAVNTDGTTTEQPPSSGSEEVQEPPIVDASTIFMRKLDQSLSQFHLESMEAIRKLEDRSNTEPAWVTELLKTSKQTADDVSKLKEQINCLKCSKCQTQILLDEASAKLMVKKPSIDEWLYRVMIAMYCMVFDVEDPTTITINTIQNKLLISTSTSTKAPVTLDPSGLSLLILYIQNLIKYPEIPRYRRIVTNVTYKTTLAPIRHHDKVLESVGFFMSKSSTSSTPSTPTTPSTQGIWEWRWHTATATVATSNPTDIPDKEMIPVILQLAVDLLELSKGGSEQFLSTLQKKLQDKQTLVLDSNSNSSSSSGAGSIASSSSSSSSNNTIAATNNPAIVFPSIASPVKEEAAARESTESRKANLPSSSAVSGSLLDSTVLASPAVNTHNAGTSEELLRVTSLSMKGELKYDDIYNLIHKEDKLPVEISPMHADK